MDNNSKPTLTYFSSRGLAENIRILLAEAKVDYEEIGLGVFNNGGQPSQFIDLRASGVLPFNLVPLWVEPGGVSLTQSGAILRHLARKYHFYGQNENEASRCDELMDGLLDFRMAIRTIVGGADKEAAKKELMDVVIPKWIGFYEKILHSHGQGHQAFFIGSHATVVDFMVWYYLEYLDDQKLIDLHHFPTLAAFKVHIESRPAIIAHRSNPKRYPIQNYFN